MIIEIIAFQLPVNLIEVKRCRRKQCLKQNALTVEKLRWFHSNRLKASLFTVRNVSLNTARNPQTRTVCHVRTIQLLLQLQLSLAKKVGQGDGITGLHVKRLSQLGLSTSLLQHHKKGCFFADASFPGGVYRSQRGVLCL